MNAVKVNYTARGRERIRRLEEVIGRFYKRAEARKKRPLSIVIGISHEVDLFVLKMRCGLMARGLGWPPLADGEAEKLIVFVWTRGRKITWV